MKSFSRKRLLGLILALITMATITSPAAQASDSDPLLGRWVGPEGDEITFFDFSGENRFVALEKYFPVEGIYTVSGSSIHFVGRKSEVAIYDGLSSDDTPSDDYNVTMTFRVDGDTLTLGGREYTREVDGVPTLAAEEPSNSLPRPGDFLFGDYDYGTAYSVYGGTEWHPEFGPLNMEFACIILVESAYAHEITSAMLVLKGDVELVESVISYKDGITYEDCTKFYGVRDYYTDGELTGVTITEPPVNTALEIYFSGRLTHGNGGAWIARYSNSTLVEQMIYSAVSTTLSPYPASRPVGTGSLSDYFIFNDGSEPGDFVRLRPNVALPEIRPDAISTDPRDPRPIDPIAPPVDSPDAMPFTDIKTTDWFYDAVEFCYENGLMTGTSATTFSPENNLTVGQAITMAARAHAGGDDGFTQGTPWYDVYVDYALAHHIINAGDFTNYEALATRAEMAYIFANVLSSDLEATEDLVPPDVAEGDKYADEIYFLYGLGVLMGNDDIGTFTPDTNITRAQAAAILLRTYKLIS